MLRTSAKILSIHYYNKNMKQKRKNIRYRCLKKTIELFQKGR